MTSTDTISAAAVARAAGVSPAAVSYALNGRPGVSERTRERILALAAELGHVPTSTIGERRIQRTHALGLVVTDIANPFYTEIAAGVIDAARAQGCEVFLAHTQERPEVLSATIDTMIERRVDGIILSVLHREDGEIVRALHRAHTPFVQLSRRMDKVTADFVGIDDHGGAVDVMNHVLDHGYTDIATIIGPRTSSASAAREEAFAATAAERGVRIAGRRRVSTYLSEDGGARAVERLYRDGPMPRVLVCGSDAIALGAMGALRARGMRVPEDVAVTGFDGVLPGVAPLVDLTTVVQPRRDMAERAVALLLARVSGQGGASESFLLDHTLRVGSSCGCREGSK